MNVLVINKSSFNCTEYDDIKNISFTTTQFTITLGNDQTATFNKADYLLSIKW